MKSHRASVSFSLALKYMLLLSAAMLSLSLLLVVSLRFSVTWRQDEDLRQSVDRIGEVVRRGESESIVFLELPYYITYTVYKPETKKVLVSNDSLLPLLDSEEICRTYLEKDYFTDSDLHIRYLTRKFESDEGAFVVECALDLANDSASRMIFALPSMLLFLLLPVLLLSFALSFLISRRTIAAFKTLQADYNREKAFTSNVSHELKTPIAVIDGHANLLRRWGKDDPVQLSKSIEAILRETGHMSAIVTTLLDMSRLENGRIALEPREFLVKNLFLRLKDEFSALYPSLHFDLSDPDCIEVRSDEQKVHQIFTVILSNSVKFAGETCSLVLSARKLGSKTELSVTDSGPGFAPDVLPHVFERFYKGDASHDRSVGGAGLGLSIAQSLTHALGGHIRAENASSGGAHIVLLL